VKSRLFWKLGAAHLGLIFFVVVIVDAYVVRSLRREYLDAGFAQLESISRLAETHPPQSAGSAALKEWAAWMARSGIRVTLVALDGTVLADSEENVSRMDNHIGRPEIRATLEHGSGRAVRHSATAGHDLLYLANRGQTENGTPLIVRFSLPLYRLDEALTHFRRGLWIASLIILVGAAAASLLSFRALAQRIERLKQFSARIAAGDFRQLPLDRKGDELADLSATMNQTAAQLDATVRTLTEERNQSAAVLAAMAEGVVVIGPGQRVLFCNAAFRRAMNLEEEGWQNRSVVEVVPNADLLGFLEQARAANATVANELVIGSIRTRSFAVTIAPIGVDGSPAGLVMVLHDISEIRRLERARRDFVANVSHEFKTPLTAIRGFAETLLHGALEDRQNSRRFLGIICEHAERLARLTDDLLQLSQIEAGKLDLQRRPVSIAEIIEPCLETVRLKAEEKELAIDCYVSPDLPLVNADPLALQQALQNLVDNAVRYNSPGGRIEIRAQVRDACAVIAVSDTGPGIPQAEQGRIFERFYRMDTARSRAAGGTGLGLSIAKHLAEAHGGRIELQSEVGRGSTFTLVLPL